MVECCPLMGEEDYLFPRLDECITDENVMKDDKRHKNKDTL
jgi:hypothetical protein